MPNDTDPIVLMKPEGIFSLKNPKTRIFLLVVILFCLAIAIYIGIQLIIKELNKPKILAYVNNEPISEKFLKEKMADGCLVEKSDNQSKALEKWIDFLVLKNGAKELGIEASSSGQNIPDAKICPEADQKTILQNNVKKKIMPYRRVSFLAVESNKKSELTKLVKDYNSNKYPSLRSAALKFITMPKEATSSAFTTFQRVITPDIDKAGIYNDPDFLETVFKLKTAELSQIFSPTEGSLANKLVVIQVLEIGGQPQFSSFKEWFSQVKNQTAIKYNK